MTNRGLVPTASQRFETGYHSKAPFQPSAQKAWSRVRSVRASALPGVGGVWLWSPGSPASACSGQDLYYKAHWLVESLENIQQPQYHILLLSQCPALVCVKRPSYHEALVCLKHPSYHKALACKPYHTACSGCRLLCSIDSRRESLSLCRCRHCNALQRLYRSQSR